LTEIKNKKVLVIGLGLSGVAAAEALIEGGAEVVALDSADTPSLRRAAASFEARGVTVRLNAGVAPKGDFDLVVTSPGVPWDNPVLSEMVRRGVPIIGELELGYQRARCLNIAITGTNGKTTTTELVERLLQQNQIKTIAAGNIGRPICSVIQESAGLDYLTLEVSSFQLETIREFRPAIAVLMNITPDHLDRYAGMDDYARAKGRIFQNQQAFDWAIIQAEALAQLRRLGCSIPGKVITFSAQDPTADICLERGLLISRVEGWSGPLLDQDHCRLCGPHNAENLMATLAVGRVLRIPLERMLAVLKSYEPAPHRCELVAEVDGVKFINDSKATNLDALHKALLSTAPGPGGKANVWVIAGGKDKGFEFHDVGPLLAQRAKGAFLIGETREKIRAAWGLFAPCTLADSLLEAVHQAAAKAVAGDVVLLSPACSSFDQFQNYQHRGEVFRKAVLDLGARLPQASAAPLSAS
jgi:UDP-N-acetylmuramoylalanine--D-glutamate ligase